MLSCNSVDFCKLLNALSYLTGQNKRQPRRNNLLCHEWLGEDEDRRKIQRTKTMGQPVKELGNSLK